MLPNAESNFIFRELFSLATDGIPGGKEWLYVGDSQKFQLIMVLHRVKNKIRALSIFGVQDIAPEWGIAVLHITIQYNTPNRVSKSTNF